MRAGRRRDVAHRRRRAAVAYRPHGDRRPDADRTSPLDAGAARRPRRCVSVAALAGPGPAAPQADRTGRERIQRDHRRTGGLRRDHRRRRVPGAVLHSRHDPRPVRRSAADRRVADGGARFAGAGRDGRGHGNGWDGGQPDDAARLPRGAGASAGVVRARTARGQPRSRRGRRDAVGERRGLADRRRPRACRDTAGGTDRRDAPRGAGAWTWADATLR